MKKENKPDGHCGNKASGTEETAGRCYKINPQIMESMQNQQKFCMNAAT